MRLLALMGSANKVPVCSAGSDASDLYWVVPVPGLTGLAITSRRSHNLTEPIIPARSLMLSGSSRQRRHMTGLVSLPARHDGPDNTRHLVRHRHACHPYRLAGQHTASDKFCKIDGLRPIERGMD